MLGLKSKAEKALAESWRAEAGDFVRCVRWSPDGEALAVTPATGTVRIYRSADGRVEQSLLGHGFGTAEAAWSPDGKRLATCGQDGRARIWDGEAGMLTAEVEGGGEWVERLEWSPSGRYLATASGKRLRAWTAEGELAREWTPHASTIADIGWKPGEDILASCGYNGLAFWAPGEAEARRSFPWKGSMLALAWSPNGEHIATGNQDSTIQFWTVKTGKELHMWGYPAKIRELAWDRQSRYLASGGSATCVVWDCSGKGPAGSKPITLDFHQKLLTQLAFQKNGPLLASGCDEGLVAIWKPGKGEQRLATAHVGGSVGGLAWSPEGRRLAVGSAEGTVTVFAVEAG